MRILHTSDWHVGRTVKGRDRDHEHRAVLAEIAAIAASELVDLVVVAGDVFDSSAPSAKAEVTVYRALLDLAEVSPVVVIAGNHDHPQRLEAVAPLLELGRVRVGSVPRRADEGGRIVIETAAGPACLLLLPFLDQRHVVRADLLMSADQPVHELEYAARMQRIVAHLAQGVPDEATAIAVCHLTAVGGLLDGSERQAHTVMEYAVPATVFPASLNYVALGHLHRRQRIPAAVTTWYSGSPLQLDFGEEHDQKGVLLVDASPTTPAEVTKVVLTGGRPMLTVRGSLEALREMSADLPDAHLRVIVEDTSRPGLFDQVRAWFPDAVQVRMAAADSGLVPAAEPRLGRPPRELFAEYLTQKKAADQRVLALFEELLEEAHATPTA